MHNLHKQFVQLGRQKNKIQYKLLQLLPKIYETEIYKKYTHTIEGYAWRFAQIPASIVLKRLRLEKNLEDKPFLKEAISKVGVHKVAMMASIATAETDKIFAEKIENMSKPAVQELSKELRAKSIENINLFSEAETEKCHAMETKIKIELDGELAFQFLKFKKKFGKELNNKEIIKKIFEEAEKSSENNVQKKAQKSLPGETFEAKNIENKPIIAKTSRYIPVRIRGDALEKSHDHCSYPNCNKPPEVFHHPERFAETKNHNNVKPLCKLHHEFMHNGLVENEVHEVNKWNLSLNQNLLQTDQFYQKYRK